MMKDILDNYVRRRHGKSKTSEYRVWRSMIYRCYNQKCRNYRDYGARGIRVCDRWLKSFSDFWEDMGPKPLPLLSIHRIDNNGNYEPGNCKWATYKEQASNTRRQEQIRINKLWNGKAVTDKVLYQPTLGKRKRNLGQRIQRPLEGILINCLECGTQSQIYTKWQKFCSRKCRM